MSWEVPAGMAGDTAKVRVTATALDRVGKACPQFLAAKAHPDVWPEAYVERRDLPLLDFPLRLLTDALDAMEADQLSPEEALSKAVAALDPPAHPGVLVWAEHAVAMYQTGIATAALPDLQWQLEPNGRVVQGAADGVVKALVGWARFYASTDQRIREVRRLRMRAARRVTDPEPSTTALAFLAATGRRALDNPFRASPPVATAEADPAPERVRVVEIGLLDGSAETVFDGTLAEAAVVYRAAGAPLAAELIQGGGYRPGRDCIGCKQFSVCPALPRDPGLLGLPGFGVHRRAWSVSAAQQYLVCPAQAHLRDLRLPRDDVDDGGFARHRGLLIHDWLHAAHDRGRPCAAADVPDSDSADLGLAVELMSREDFREIRPWLVQHLSICPLNDQTGELTEAVAEPDHAVLDPDADTLVLIRPDHVRRVDGIPVWREVKTQRAERNYSVEDALRAFPQLAVALCLLADGALGPHRQPGPDSTPGVVELELLTPTSRQVLRLSTEDQRLVNTARKQLVDLSLDWHDDRQFNTRPGPWCAGCPVARWCPDRYTRDGSGVISLDGVRVDLSSGEILDAVRTEDRRPEAVAAALSKEPVEDEDAPPF